MKEFPFLPHGFLHFGLISPDAEAAVNKIGDWLLAMVNPEKAAEEKIIKAEREAELDMQSETRMPSASATHDNLVIRGGHIEVPPSASDNVMGRQTPSITESLLQSWQAVKDAFGASDTAEFP